MKTFKFNLSEKHYFEIAPDRSNYTCTEFRVRTKKNKEGVLEDYVSSDIWYPATLLGAFVEIYQRLVKDTQLEDQTIADYKEMALVFKNCLDQVKELGMSLDNHIKESYEKSKI